MGRAALRPRRGPSIANHEFRCILPYTSDRDASFSLKVRKGQWQGSLVWILDVDTQTAFELKSPDLVFFCACLAIFGYKSHSFGLVQRNFGFGSSSSHCFSLFVTLMSSCA